MQIWYLFKVSASEQIPLQNWKDANEHVRGSNCFKWVDMPECLFMKLNRPQLFVITIIINGVTGMKIWYLFRVHTFEQMP